MHIELYIGNSCQQSRTKSPLTMFKQPSCIEGGIESYIYLKTGNITLHRAPSQHALTCYWPPEVLESFFIQPSIFIGASHLAVLQ